MTTLLSNTLPTVIGMGVVSQTVQTMPGLGGKRGSKSTRRTKIVTKTVKAKVICVSSIKSEAVKKAAKFRAELRRQGRPYAGKVKVAKAPGGYVAYYQK